jgi:hypothetical protein
MADSVAEEKMRYLVYVTKTCSGYQLIWSSRVGVLTAGPGLPKFFVHLTELLAYLRERTDFSRSYEPTLLRKLNSDGCDLIPLNPTYDEEQSWCELLARPSVD